MNRFKDLNVWQESMKLAKEVYGHADQLPGEEKFGLTAQIKRSAVSIPSNIAEGAGRNHPKEFSQFLGIAAGSACELQTQLILAGEIGFLAQNELTNLEARLEHIKNMLYKLMTSLKKQNTSYKEHNTVKQ